MPAVAASLHRGNGPLRAWLLCRPRARPPRCAPAGGPLVRSLQLAGDTRDRLLRADALGFQLPRTPLQGLQVAPVVDDHLCIAHVPVARHDAGRADLRQHRQGLQPRAHARGGADERRQGRHRHVTGEEDAIVLDEEDRVASCVRRADGQEADLHSAEVEPVLALEDDVGGPIRGASQQVGDHRGPLAERPRQLQVELLDVLNLCAGADHAGAGWKRGRAEIMLWMEVCGCQIELGMRAHLAHLAHDHLAVLRAEAGVDDQRCARADDDADVRDQSHVAVGDDEGVGGHLRGDALPDERPGRLRLRLCAHLKGERRHECGRQYPLRRCRRLGKCGPGHQRSLVREV